jgi:putative FmdB family regulatory protein
LIILVPEEEDSMPIYEYRCEKCNTVIEKIQKFSDPILTECEVCGGPLVKLFGKPALQFKGSGFYITDYVKKTGSDSSGETKTPTPAPKEAASSEGASSGDKSSSSTEVKSA